MSSAKILLHKIKKLLRSLRYIMLRFALKKVYILKTYTKCNDNRENSKKMEIILNVSSDIRETYY